MRNRKTTKLLALALSLLMLFTMIPLSVSAGETGTILDTTIEGIETDGNGNYYLTGDVKVTATYADEFTGTFDGRGFTVTTSVPLFKSVNNATIENLTVDEGTITGYAAVASLVTGGKTTFKNVTNNASVTNNATITAGSFTDFTSKYVVVAGLAGSVYSGNAEFIDCTNNGEIAADATNVETPSAGIVGYVSSSTITVEGCTNRGVVSGARYVGGIVGGANGSTVSINDCYNEAAVTTSQYNVGGIAGGFWSDTEATVVKCGNTADIESKKNDGSSGAYVGGIVGTSTKTSTSLNVSYCYNTGDIKSNNGKCVAGIVGRITLSQDNSIVGCYNSGGISGLNDHCAQIYWGTTEKMDLGENYYLSSSLPACTANGSTYSEYDKSYENDTLTSGKLAYDMNKAIGKTVYYQNVNAGTTTDDHPVLDSTHGHVFKSGDDYYSIAFYTLNKASIRLRADHSGLRFATAVSVEDYNALKDKFTLSFGTLITPDAYLDVALGGGYSFTKDGLANLNTDNPYLDVTPAGVGTEVFNPLEGEDTKYYYFCGSITGIKEDNYEWDYSAIGYVSVGDQTFYSSDYVTSNISHIANLAYNDRQATQSTTYKYEIAADSEYAIDNKVSYSPYSPSESENTIDELKIIRGYL